MKTARKITLSCICLLLVFCTSFLITSCGDEAPQLFNLTFKVDGEDYQTTETSGAERITIPQDPEKEGYSFDGWYWDEGVWAKPFTANSLLNAPITSNMAIHAKFSPIEYEIKYEDLGGIHSNPASYTIEDSFELSDAERRGYTFLGWYADAEHTEKVEAVSRGSVGAITLYAKYDINEYTVTYADTKDVFNGNPTAYTVETETIELVDLEKLGYTFLGWYNNEERVTEIEKGSIGNVTLTAKWSAVNYAITYNGVDGANNTNPYTYNVENEPLVLLDASRVGYTFLGWYADSEFSEKITEIAVGTVGAIELYAKWEIIEYTATFMDGSTKIDEVKFTVEIESITEPAVPEYIGYTGKWESYTLGAKNITVNAIYTPIVYTITYVDTKGASNSNPQTYTIESTTITLKDISANGYEFDGWFDANGARVTEITGGSLGDITLTAKWTLITYTITYMYDADIGDYVDSTVNPTTYTVEDEFDFVVLVNKINGYTFAGWFTEKNNGTGTRLDGIYPGMIGNITLYAQWGLENYSITYHNSDGVTNTNATSYTIETDSFDIYDVSRAGYTFDGWYSDSEFNTVVTQIAKGTTGNIDLYAKWTVIEYEIDYVLYGGSYVGEGNPSSYTVEDEIVFNAPTLEGQYFVGWFTLAENGERITSIEKGNTGRLTLYARYISFDSNGGSDIDYTLTVDGAKISEPEDPEKEHYTFVGWFVDAELTDEFDFSIPTESLTLYAKFDLIKYKITYVLNGGTNPKEQVQEYTVENRVSLLDPSKVGYTFVGWFTDAKFTSAVVTEIKPGTNGELTFYANYSINKYTINFNSNGGTDVEAIAQNYATAVIAPPTPAKNGYSFAGWYSDSTLKNAYTFNTIPAENITLYAKWNLETYKITYNLAGGTNNSQNPAAFTINSADITLKDPIKDGYNFAGWHTDSGYNNAITKIAKGSYGNKELFAKWDIITYTVTYVMPNGAVNSNLENYTVETNLSDLVNASLKGHTFAGWYKDSEYKTRVYQIGGGEIGDITIYAKFIANTYDVWLDGTDEAKFTVTFDLNGASGNVASQTVTENNTLKYPAVPMRSGYLFGGWYTSEDCDGVPYDFTALITSDITLYAKWVEVDNSIVVNSNVTVTLNGREEQKFSFVPLVSGNVTFTTTGSYDTLGILYDASGNVLKMDDDTGSDGVNFQIVFNVTAGEVYTISVSSYSSATSGTATLYVSGSNTVTAGGYVITGNKTQITYGSAFTLSVPSAREGYKFLGWADKNGTMYTDGTGASVKAWDKDETTILVSVWERTVYTITFVTSGGTSIDKVTLAYGDRLDISKYVTTRANYTFDCWMLDGSAFNATTMPDRNITLTAKWKAFALGEIKYDEAKLVISVNDEITAELFGAICIDTNGQKAEFTVTVSGTQAAGETISVRLVAKSGNKTKQVTITGIKVYGAPTLSFDNTVNYVNLVGGMTAEHFVASGTDTFGNATDIKVYIEGDHKPGDLVTVVIESIDPAGNSILGYVYNVKAYGPPKITYNENKTAISVNDTINASLFGASAVDSFGESLTVTVTNLRGTIAAGNTVTVRVSATDSKGNVTNIDIPCKVYGAPTISNATKTNVKVSDVITPELLGITGKDTYGNSLNVTLTVKEGTQAAGTTMVVTATVTDIAGNVTAKDCELKIYGTPKVFYDRGGVKLNEAVTAESLNAIAYDSFGNALEVSVSLKSGNVAKVGTYVIYTLLATDAAGNTCVLDTSALGVYDAADIQLTYNAYMSDIARLASDGSEFDASSSDTFGNPCRITIEADDGSALVGGTTRDIVLVATDAAGNRKLSSVISGIKIYDMPRVVLNQDNHAVTESTDMSFLFTVYDSFGEELYAEVTVLGEQKAGNIVTATVVATDDAGNIVAAQYTFGVLPTEKHFVELYIDGELWKALFIDNSSDYTLPMPTLPDSLESVGWLDKCGDRYSDNNGIGLLKLPESIQLYCGIYESGYTPIFTVEQLKSISMDENCVLFADLNFGGMEWTPLGTELNPFMGIFDGNGYTISNLNIVTPQKYAGIFGYNLGSIKNLSVMNITINVITSSYLTTYYGGLVGYNGGALINCYVVGNISAEFDSKTNGREKSLLYVGGVAGYNDNSGIISSCYSECEINTVTLALSETGGLVGSNGGTITNCYAECDVKSAASTYGNDLSLKAGGLVGVNSGVIANCYSDGSIECNASSYNGYTYVYTGGLIGINTGEVAGCYSKAYVETYAKSTSSRPVRQAHAGGLVGNNSGTITNCYASGRVRCSISKESVASGGDCFAGGLIGNNSGTITSCYATGDVSSMVINGGYERAGGLVGENEGAVINCYRCGSSRVDGGNRDNTGSVVSIEELTTIEFHLNIVNWSEEHWSFIEGEYPTLINAK